MLESTRRLSCWHHRALHASKSIAEKVAKNMGPLIYWASPEDTTEKTGDRQLQTAKYDRVDINGVVKTVLWIAVSITLSLFIGKLN
jgi:hypothetical protein